MKIQAALVLAAISATSNAQVLTPTGSPQCQLTSNSPSDGSGLTQTCVAPVYNLQYDDTDQSYDSANNTWILSTNPRSRLYDVSTGEQSWTGYTYITNEATIAAEVISARNPANIKTFSIPTSDWDGCYKRLPAPAAVQTYWALEALKITRLDTIRTNIDNIVTDHSCRLQELREFEVDWLSAQSLATTDPAYIATGSSASYSTYVLSTTMYNRDSDGRGLIESAIPGASCTVEGYIVNQESSCSYGSPGENDFTTDRGNWTTAASTDRAAAKRYQEDLCQYNAAVAWNAQFSSNQTPTQIDAWAGGLDTTNWTTASSDFNSRFGTYDLSQATAEVDEFNYEVYKQKVIYQARNDPTVTLDFTVTRDANLNTWNDTTNGSGTKVTADTDRILWEDVFSSTSVSYNADVNLRYLQQCENNQIKTWLADSTYTTWKADENNYLTPYTGADLTSNWTYSTIVVPTSITADWDNDGLTADTAKSNKVEQIITDLQNWQTSTAPTTRDNTLKLNLESTDGSYALATGVSGRQVAAHSMFGTAPSGYQQVNYAARDEVTTDWDLDAVSPRDVSYAMKLLQLRDPSIWTSTELANLQTALNTELVVADRTRVDNAFSAEQSVDEANFIQLLLNEKYTNWFTTLAGPVTTNTNVWLDNEEILTRYYTNSYDDMWTRTQKSKDLLTATSTSTPTKTTVAQQIWDTWLGTRDSGNVNYLFNGFAQLDEHNARVTQSNSGSHNAGSTIGSGTTPLTATYTIKSYNDRYADWVAAYDAMWTARKDQWTAEQDWMKYCMPTTNFNAANCSPSTSSDSALATRASTQVNTLFLDKNGAQKSLKNIMDDAYVACSPLENDVTEWTNRNNTQAGIVANAQSAYDAAQRRANADGCVATTFRTQIHLERDNIADNLNQVLIDETAKLTRISNRLNVITGNRNTVCGDYDKYKGWYDAVLTNRETWVGYTSPTVKQSYSRWGNEGSYNYLNFVTSQFYGEWECTPNSASYATQLSTLDSNIRNTNARNTFSTCTGRSLLPLPVVPTKSVTAPTTPPDTATSQKTTLFDAIRNRYQDQQTGFNYLYEYSINVFNYNKHALAADTCVVSVPTYEQNIRTAEGEINGYKTTMYTLPSSGRAYYTTDLSANLLTGVNSVTFTTTRVDLTQQASNLGQVATNVPVNQLRRLQTAIGYSTPSTTTSSSPTVLTTPSGTAVDDEAEVKPHLGLGEGPVSITTCVNSAGELSGFQVWYRSFRTMAGPAHGDLSTTCTKTDINGSVIEIVFYGNHLVNVNRPQGMIIRMNNNADGVYNAKNSAANSIVVGQTDLSDQIRQSIRFETDPFTTCYSTNAFFGFKTTSVQGVFETIEVISYNADEQRRLTASPANYNRITEAQAAVDLNTAWSNGDMFFPLIIQKATYGGLATPAAAASTMNAAIAAVYRPEQLAADEATLAQQIAAVTGQVAATTTQVAQAVNTTVAGSNTEPTAQVVANASSGNTTSSNTTETTSSSSQTTTTTTTTSTTTTSADLTLDEATAARVTEEYNFHADENDEDNAGAIAALVIGSVLLFGMLLFCCYRAMKMRDGGMMSGGASRSRQTGATILVNQSRLSDQTSGNQRKLDDIM